MTIDDWLQHLEELGDDVLEMRRKIRALGYYEYPERLNDVSDAIHDLCNQLDFIKRQADCPPELKGE